MTEPKKPYTLRGVVPHHGDDWPYSLSMPPYPIALTEFARAFTYTPSRLALFTGLLHQRRLLKARGINGVQWVNGSFVQSESLYGRDPEDIDLLTWVSCGSEEEFNRLVSEIDGNELKRVTHCHSFFAPAINGAIPWPLAGYWLWLFGHTNTSKVVDEKDRGLAKGFFVIDLADSEESITLGAEHAQA